MTSEDARKGSRSGEGGIGLSLFATLAATGVVIVSGWVAVRALELSIGAVASGSATEGEPSIWLRPDSGAFWGLSIIVGGVVECGAAGVLLSLWGRRGVEWREVLAIRGVPLRTVTLWLAIALLFGLGCDGITGLTGRPIVPEAMREAYATAGSDLCFWLALVGVAPVVEEVIFRGLLFGGVERSGLGCWGAIGLSTGLWAATHRQYDAWGVFIVVLAGVLLGWARLQTRSIMVSWMMHALLNALAVVEATFWEVVFE